VMPWLRRIPLVMLAFALAGSAPAAARTAHRCAHHRRCVATPAAKRTAASTSPTDVVVQLTDAEAAALVHRARETRPDNRAANHNTLSASQLDYFRATDSSMPSRYKDAIDGAFTGTTDEVIQWAAYKWGLDPQLLRAAAAVESWWHMSTVGDNGSSFGLFQIREPYHCCQRFAQGSTAFNADYYGAIVRSYYDGTQTWLNTVSGNGRGYGAGDLWGSVGYWASGRWHDANAEAYAAKVRADLASQPWLGRWF
jgi:hypothetical protein